MNTKSKVPILLIEDNQADVDLIRIALNDVGFKHEFYHTDSLFEGVEMVNTHDIEVVLLDLSLSDSSGYKTISKFLEKISYLPVIVLTGMNNEIIGNQAVKAGAQDFLVKGQFDSKILGRAIRYALQRFKTHHKLEQLARDLAISENRFLEAQELAHFGNWEMDIVSFEMKWSDEVFRIFGFDPETIAPTLSDYLNYVHREDKEALELFFENAGKDGALHQLEHRIIVNGKQIKFVNVQAKIYFDEYFEKALLVGSLQDITERKLSEQLLFEKQISNQEAKIQEQVFEGMNFQIRTPLNSIINLLYLLENTSTNGQQSDFIGQIKTSVDDLSIVLNNMMNFSVLSRGKLALKPEVFNTSEFLGGLSKMVSLKAENAKVKFDFSFQEELPKKIIVDGSKISLVFFNLIDLIIKSIPAEENLSAQVEFSNKNLIFKINSGGNRINFEQSPEIKVSNIDQANLSDEEQNSLNINIILKLIKSLGGTFENSSIENKSEIIFKIPSDVVKNDNSFEGQKPIAPLNILMAEDHFLNQISTKKVLQSWSEHVSVAIAENGKIAVEKLASQNFDLVLMDIQMPKMNGIEATQAIRKFSQIPIIALTANASKQEADKCLKEGMNGYLSKPFKPEDLYQKIMESLTKVKV